MTHPLRREMMDTPLLSAWLKTAVERPRTRALTDLRTEKTITFSALDQLARTRASEISAQNRSMRMAGKLWLIALPNGIEWFADYLAALHLGMSIAATDPDVPSAALTRLADALGAAAISSPHGTVVTDSAKAYREAWIVKLTSGTTGQPRPLFFHHREMIADGDQIISSMQLRRSDVNFALIPCGHSYGLGSLVVPFLTLGMRIVFGSAPFPSVIASEIAAQRPTVFPAVPPLLRALTESDVASEQLSSLRTVISAGSALSPELAAKFAERFGTRIHNFYGSSETGGIAYDRSGEATLEGRAIGTPLDGVHLSATRNGELRVCSDAVMTRGNRLSENGHGAWIVSDQVTFNDAGEVVLGTRSRRMAKVGARRVSLGEIEAALLGIEGVTEAWAGTRPGSGGDDLLVCAWTGIPGPEAVRPALRRELPAWKTPKRMKHLDAFPRTSRGKVDTAALQREFASD